MTQSNPSDSAYSAPTRTYSENIGEGGEASSDNRCRIFEFSDFQPPAEPAPADHNSIDDLAAEWESDPVHRARLAEGRRWVADRFYGGEGETVRSLRLHKGWSQTRLAESMSTSQSHVARIERGTENLTIETCRKLARALEIDMNRLDQALQRQDNLARGREK